MGQENIYGSIISAGIVTSTVFPLTTWLLVGLGFNKFNALTRLQQATREPFLARCDNAF